LRNHLFTLHTLSPASAQHPSRIINTSQVTCYAGSTGNKTCKGDLCYTERFVNIMHNRGCITMNSTLPGESYKVGFVKMTQREYAFCDKPFCNFDWNSTLSNAPGAISHSSTSVPSTTTHSARLRRPFQYLLLPPLPHPTPHPRNPLLPLRQ
ncbi:hypothetical protein PMAYCL1PPCAC_21840, partial [Pristionchus mayeri]